MSAPRTWRLGEFAAVRAEPFCGAVEIVYAIKGLTPELYPGAGMFPAADTIALGQTLKELGHRLIKAGQDAEKNAAAAKAPA